MKSKKIILLILSVIILVALGLRIFRLGDLPMYGDELTMVQDSYSLFKTGLDQTGASFPITFKMGAGRPAGYVYFSIPFVAIFGPTTWGIRGLSVLSSLGLILIAFLLTKKFFSEKIALLVAFILTVSPWDLSLGRGGFESHFALFLAVLGSYLLLDIDKRKFNLLWATLVWGLTINTYPTYKVILPIFLVVIVWFLGGVKKILAGKKVVAFFSGVLALGIISVTLTQTFIGGSEDRFKKINIFSSENAAVEQDVNFNRAVSLGNGVLGKIFYNKPLSFFKLLGDSYLKVFSLEYLIISGDGNPRHNMASTGVIWIVELITVAFGIKYLVDLKDKRRQFVFVVLWLLVSPVASIFTLENHGLRTNFMIFPLAAFSALGIAKIWENKNKLFIGAIITFWVVQFIPAMQRIYFLAPNRFARFWSNLAKDVSIKVNTRKNNFDYVILSTRIDNLEYAYPVYSKLNPKEIIANNQEKIILEGYRFKKFENVYLGSVPEENLVNFIDVLPGKIMYVGPFSEANLFSKYEILYDRDKVPSGIVYEK